MSIRLYRPRSAAPTTTSTTTSAIQRLGSRPEPIMPEMSALSGKSKVPMLSPQGVSYAKWGRWVDAFSSCLTLKGLHLSFER